MDGPVDDVDELAANLRDIAFANAHLGGTAPVVRALRRIDAPRLSLLDVGSGAGDVAVALAHDASRRGVELHVTCLDQSEQMLAIARAATGGAATFAFVRADGGALPFADGAFDIVTCTLALHHFDPSDARAMLRELRRVARVAPVVCDLRRSALGFALTWLWSRTSGNRLTRHDAPLSVRRAYTPSEAIALARGAGWLAPQVRREPFFRMTLTDSAA